MLDRPGCRSSNKPDLDLNTAGFIAERFHAVPIRIAFAGFLFTILGSFAASALGQAAKVQSSPAGSKQAPAAAAKADDAAQIAAQYEALVAGLPADQQAWERTLQLREQEGIFAGPSSGAVLDVAIRAAERIQEGKIVIILADGGWKYLSEQNWTAHLAGQNHGADILPAPLGIAL